MEYFKTLDECDIIQEDYSETEELNSLINDNKILSVEEANNLLMRSVKLTSLDKLVKRTILKKEEEIIPIQKEINLNDPYLKNKGICQKKNIINKYEETSDNKKISTATEVNENKKEEK